MNEVSCTVQIDSRTWARRHLIEDFVALIQKEIDSIGPGKTRNCLARLHIDKSPLLLGGGCTSDNLDQLASNDGLTGSVEENLVLVDHVSSVLGGILCHISILCNLNRQWGDLHPWHYDERRFHKHDLQ